MGIGKGDADVVAADDESEIWVYRGRWCAYHRLFWMDKYLDPSLRVEHAGVSSQGYPKVLPRSFSGPSRAHAHSHLYSLYSPTKPSHLRLTSRPILPHNNLPCPSARSA